MLANLSAGVLVALALAIATFLIGLRVGLAVPYGANANNPELAPTTWPIEVVLGFAWFGLLNLFTDDALKDKWQRQRTKLLREGVRKDFPMEIGQALVDLAQAEKADLRDRAQTDPAAARRLVHILTDELRDLERVRAKVLANASPGPGLEISVRDIDADLARLRQDLDSARQRTGK